MQRIFLTGSSGSGKTAIGRRAASLLGWRFMDTEDILTRRSGIPVSQLLAEYGEERFGQLESDVLHELVNGERVVIATCGDRAISNTRNTFMREHGLIAHLHASADINTKADTQNVLAQRLVSQALVQGHLSSPYLAREIVTLHPGDVHSQAVIEWAGLPHLGLILRELEFPERLFIVIDSQVGDLYASSLRILVEDAGFKPSIVTIPAGEANKSLACFKQIIDWLVECKAERNEPIIAVGGGVVGDIAGFVASSYRRGVPFIQVPTTLLAQVDSAIGGKTGVNHAFGKNFVGSYYQPALIYVDPALVLTLPERIYSEGWAEIVKYAMVLDMELFTLLEENLALLQIREPSFLASIVTRCIRLKMNIVQLDELDFDVRSILNYGHTFGHALEATTNHGTWLHGEAVAIGMEVAARIAVATSTLSREEATRQARLLQALNLPVRCPGADAMALLDTMLRDKKVRAGHLRWILPTRIGHAEVCDDIDPALVHEAVIEVCRSKTESV
jgi:3-dehydroquinate synthase